MRELTAMLVALASLAVGCAPMRTRILKDLGFSPDRLSTHTPDLGPDMRPSRTPRPLPTYTPYPAPERAVSPAQEKRLAPTLYPTYTPYPTYTLYPLTTAMREPSSTASAVSPTPSSGTRQNPAAVGETLRVRRGNAEFTVTIAQVITGPEASDRITEANRFNKSPLEGSEFVLFYVTAILTKGPAEGTVSVSTFDWRMVDNTGKVWRPPTVVDPRPEFEGAGFEGAFFEGWVTHIRKSGETVSLVFGMSTAGTGGAWFEIPA